MFDFHSTNGIVRLINSNLTIIKYGVSGNRQPCEWYTKVSNKINRDGTKGTNTIERHDKTLVEYLHT